MEEFTITQEMLAQYNIEIDDFEFAIAGLEEGHVITLFDDFDNVYWIITSEPDGDGNNIPDFFDILIQNAIVTKPSVGGIGT